MFEDIMNKLTGMPKEIKRSGHMGPKEAVEKLNRVRPQLEALHKYFEEYTITGKQLEGLDRLEREYFQAANCLHDWAKDHFAKMPDLPEKPEKSKRRGNQ